MKKYLEYLICLLILCFSFQIEAKDQLNLKNQKGDKIIELSFSPSSIYYTKKKCISDESSDCKMKATSGIRVVASTTYAVHDNIDLYALGGVSLFSSMESDGFISVGGFASGYNIGVGLRGKLFLSNSMKLVPYTQLMYTHFSAQYNGDMSVSDMRISGYEVGAGIMVAIQLSQKNTFYSTVHFVPYSKVNVSGGFNDVYSFNETEKPDDYEAKNRKATYKLGLNHKINNNKYIHAEVATGGESSFTLGVGFTF